jgi:hypothetical protein
MGVEGGLGFEFVVEESEGWRGQEAYEFLGGGGIGG